MCFASFFMEVIPIAATYLFSPLSSSISFSLSLSLSLFSIVRQILGSLTRKTGTDEELNLCGAEKDSERLHTRTTAPNWARDKEIPSMAKINMRAGEGLHPLSVLH